MSDSPFDDLIREVDEARKSLEQIVSNGGMKRTVIVHPQLSKDSDEAAKLASDWTAREQKQLMANAMAAFGE